MFGLINRRSVLLAGLAAAISVPYMWNDPKMQEYVGGVKKLFTPAADGATNDSGTSAASSATANATAPPSLDSMSGVDTLPSTLEGPPVADFGEVIRFDVDPRWITERWSRVTTVLSDYNLEGLRVPFVSGTKLDDVAGALTYYYDKTHQLQRITLHGFTGDERRLAAFVQNSFGLQPTPSLYAALYMAKWNGKPMSAMVVRMAPVVMSSSPHSRLEILLEINRPSQYYDLSGSFRQMLDHGQKNERWGR